MEKKQFSQSVAKVISDLEKENIKLGIDIGDLKRQYFYKDLMQFLKGDKMCNGSLYFDKLKPLYDKYGYEKVNRVLFELEEESAKETTEEEKGEDNE